MSRSIATVGAFLLLATCVTGCATSLSEAARKRGAMDLDCAPEFVTAYRAEGGTYVASGCERWIQYMCVYSGGGAVCAREADPKPKPMPGS